MADDTTPDPDEDATSNCPACGGPMLLVAIRGPSDAAVSPCGCRVAPESVSDRR